MTSSQSDVTSSIHACWPGVSVSNSKLRSTVPVMARHGPWESTGWPPRYDPTQEKKVHTNAAVRQMAGTQATTAGRNCKEIEFV